MLLKKYFKVNIIQTIMNSSDTSKRFAIIGLGFISERHLSAIDSVGGSLEWACDIDASKRFKVEDTRFKVNYKDLPLDDFDYVSICTPNHLHYEMALYFAKAGKKVIVEKPFITHPSKLDEFKEFEDKVFIVQQLRFDKNLQSIATSIEDNSSVEMEIHVRRDDWYFEGWKGSKMKSGGLLFNIGIHYFDILNWFLGDHIESHLTDHGDKFAKGWSRFKKGTAKWSIRLDAPQCSQKRLIKVNDRSINLSRNFEGLHKSVYASAMEGNGIRPSEVKELLGFVGELSEPL